MVWILLLANIFASVSFAEIKLIDVAQVNLDKIDKNENSWQWLDSEKPFFYAGLTPSELAANKKGAAVPTLPDRLHTKAKELFPKVVANLTRKKLTGTKVELEVWPTFDGWGLVTWAVVRYRESSRDDWKWIVGDATFGDELSFPDFIDPSTDSGKKRIIEERVRGRKKRLIKNENDNLALEGFYARPEFQSIVWVLKDKKTPRREMTQVIAAWESYRDQALVEKVCALGNSDLDQCEAISVDPPARVNGKPKTWIAQVDKGKVTFSEEIAFEKDAIPKELDLAESLIDFKFPLEKMKDRYTKYLKELTGAVTIYSPLHSDRKKIDFTKQSSADPQNQLFETATYIASLHGEWGYAQKSSTKGHMHFEFQDFKWLDKIPQRNVIVRIEGKDKKVVSGSAHYDKAVAEDLFAKETKEEKDPKKWKRVTTPGADDNISGVAAVLIAAELLGERYKNKQPQHTIELVYFTAEEFPTGTLGARHYVSEALKSKKEHLANVNLDMIGHRVDKDVVYQINPGFHRASWQTAFLAKTLAQKHLKEDAEENWKPTIRKPWERSSFITQTDSSIFDWAGLPTLLLSEHINLGHYANSTYHQSTDTWEPFNIDTSYALAQTRVFVETLVHLAEKSNEIMR